MDYALLGMARTGGRNLAWAETMVNLEARKLINTANTLATFHLRDGLTRMKFVQEIKDFVEQQFCIARRAKSDEECMPCIKNLRSEMENLQEQSRMLSMKTAKLYAKVEFVRENNKIIGYVISTVKIVASGLTAIAGGVMIATMPAIGMLSGAILVMDGINGVTKEIINLNKHKNKSEGFITDGTMAVAKFMGFKPESGLAAYNTISLTAK